MAMDDKSIKKNIIQARERLGITQTDLADRVKMERNSYRALEKGSTKILNKHLDDLAVELGLSKEELVLGYDPENRLSEQSLADVRSSYQSRYDAMVANYEDRLATLREQVSSLAAECDQLRSQLRDKDTIIALMKAHTDA